MVHHVKFMRRKNPHQAFLKKEEMKKEREKRITHFYLLQKENDGWRFFTSVLY